MNRLLAIDCLPSQWTNDTLASLLSRFSGIRRSHMMANKDIDRSVLRSWKWLILINAKALSKPWMAGSWEPFYSGLASGSFHPLRAMQEAMVNETLLQSRAHVARSTAR